mmetsp:Transcript_89684/g.240603  ORF Transcript_89684/g.240603 Transcript_89684/m.240603 type:complete len:341 (+) Transcript_89684:125-1147(+)
MTETTEHQPVSRPEGLPAPQMHMPRALGEPSVSHLCRHSTLPDTTLHGKCEHRCSPDNEVHCPDPHSQALPVLQPVLSHVFTERAEGADAPHEGAAKLADQQSAPGHGDLGYEQQRAGGGVGCGCSPVGDDTGERGAVHSEADPVAEGHGADDHGNAGQQLRDRAGNHLPAQGSSYHRHQHASQHGVRSGTLPNLRHILGHHPLRRHRPSVVRQRAQHQRRNEVREPQVGEVVLGVERPRVLGSSAERGERGDESALEGTDQGGWEAQRFGPGTEATQCCTDNIDHQQQHIHGCLKLGPDPGHPGAVDALCHDGPEKHQLIASHPEPLRHVGLNLTAAEL